MAEGMGSAAPAGGHNVDDLVHRIVGAAAEVHSELGPGLSEAVYQRALGQELQAVGIQFAREVDVPVLYKGGDVGTRRVDFVIGDCIVEIKARSELLPADSQQARWYLNASQCRVGLLINFGAHEVQTQRFVNETPCRTLGAAEVATGDDDGGLADPLYEQAVRMIVTNGYASTSMIQRKFKIGYTRAARLVDAMEQQGIVGRLDGAKPREVLVTGDDLDSIFRAPPDPRYGDIAEEEGEE